MVKEKIERIKAYCKSVNVPCSDKCVINNMCDIVFLWPKYSEAQLDAALKKIEVENGK